VSIVFSILAFISQTPRAKLNVIQIVSFLFFMTILFRRPQSGKTVIDAADKYPQSWLVLTSILIMGFLLYVPTMRFYFISDDFLRLAEQWRSPLDAFWTGLTQGRGGAFFRPLGAASLALDTLFWDKWPPGYHLTNLVLHLVSVVGVYGLCKKLHLGFRVSLLAGVFFMILPIEAEAIIWVSSRFDLLATVLMIWSCFFYVDYRVNGKRLSLFLGLGAGVLALLSKESAFVIPFLWLLLELSFLRPRRWRPLAILCTAVASVFLYRWHLLGGIGGYLDSSGQMTGLELKLTTIQGLLIRAPSQMVFGLNWLQPPSFLPTLLAAIFSGILLLLAVAKPITVSDKKNVRFCIGWMLVALVPGHFLLLIDPGLTNSRVLYTSSVGLAILLAVLVSRLNSISTRGVVSAVLIVCLTLGVLHNQAAWRYSADLGRMTLVKMKTLVPAPPPRTAFSFARMPDTLNGVFFFREGLDQAVELCYGRRDLVAFRQGKMVKSHDLSSYTVIRMRFTGKQSEPLERVDR
jgi:hypothetical protein